MLVHIEPAAGAVSEQHRLQSTEYSAAVSDKVVVVDKTSTAADRLVCLAPCRPLQQPMSVNTIPIQNCSMTTSTV